MYFFCVFEQNCTMKNAKQNVQEEAYFWPKNSAMLLKEPTQPSGCHNPRKTLNTTQGTSSKVLLSEPMSHLTKQQQQ